MQTLGERFRILGRIIQQIGSTEEEVVRTELRRGAKES